MDLGSVIIIAQEIWFTEALKAATPDEALRMMKAREEWQEKMRIEAIAERRHRELCSAIRSIGPLL